MDPYAVYADAHCSAEPCSVSAAAISESSKVGLLAGPESRSEDVLPLPGSAESRKHTPDLYSNGNGAAVYCETPPRPQNDVLAKKFDHNLMEAADILHDFGMRSFKSISYNGEEIPRDPVVVELFALIHDVFEKIRDGDSEFVFEDMPELTWIPHDEKMREIYPETDSNNTPIPEGIPHWRARELSARAGKPMIGSPYDSDKSNQDRYFCPRNIGVKSRAASEDGGELTEAEAHRTEYKVETSEKPFDSPSPTRSFQTVSTEVDPSGEWYFETVDVPVKDFEKFWADKGPYVVKIRDGSVDFVGAKLFRVGVYFRALQTLENLVRRSFGSCSYSLPVKLPDKLKVTFWTKANGTRVNEEVNPDIEALNADPNHSMGSSNEIQYERVTEGVVEQSAAGLVRKRRQETPYTECENSDGNKENRSSPARSKKRLSKAPDSDRSVKRRRNQKGSSPDHPIDLTYDC